jgi:hypothetical protein
MLWLSAGAPRKLIAKKLSARSINPAPGPNNVKDSWAAEFSSGDWGATFVSPALPLWQAAFL